MLQARRRGGTWLACLALGGAVLYAGYCQGDARIEGATTGASSSRARKSIAVVSGVVVDEQGKPLGGVKAQVFGCERLSGGKWVRQFYLGDMPHFSTDKNGRFEFPFYSKDSRMDVWFEKLGYAPTFRYAISAKTGKMKVVLKRGRALSGTVTRVGEFERKPVIGTMVTLQLMTEDLGYQQRAPTGQGGRFEFRVTRPPNDKEWLVDFAGKVVEVSVRDNEPLMEVDFEVQVTATKRRPAENRGL